MKYKFYADSRIRPHKDFALFEQIKIKQLEPTSPIVGTAVAFSIFNELLQLIGSLSGRMRSPESF